MNSASPVERAVTRCKRDTQEIGVQPRNMIQPADDLQSSLPFQSESQYADFPRRCAAEPGGAHTEGLRPHKACTPVGNKAQCCIAGEKHARCRKTICPPATGLHCNLSPCDQVTRGCPAHQAWAPATNQHSIRDDSRPTRHDRILVHHPEGRVGTICDTLAANSTAGSCNSHRLVLLTCAVSGFFRDCLPAYVPCQRFFTRCVARVCACTCRLYRLTRTSGPRALACRRRASRELA